MEKHLRNSICPCGSGKKYKHCHLLIRMEKNRLALIVFKEDSVRRRKEAEVKRREHLDRVSSDPALGFIAMAIGAALPANHEYCKSELVRVC